MKCFEKLCVQIAFPNNSAKPQDSSFTTIINDKDEQQNFNNFDVKNDFKDYLINNSWQLILFGSTYWIVK